jgi:hypothetical protein
VKSSIIEPGIPDPLTLIPDNPENPSLPAPPAEKAAELPVWLQRTFLLVYVLFCIELGLLLLVVPWTPLWSNNGLLVSWPSFRHFLGHGFVRGAVSGLGLVDIWLGVLEAVRYRDRR